MCHIAVFETSDVVKAACHDLPGRIGIVGDALYGHCHFLRFVRVYVYVVGASCFFKTATCAGYYGQTALYVDPDSPNYDLEDMLKVSTAPADNVLMHYSWDKTAAALSRPIHRLADKLRILG